MGVLTAERLGLDVPIYDPEAHFNAIKDAPTMEVNPQGQRLDRILNRLGKD